MNYIEYKYEKLMELDKFYELVETNYSKLKRLELFIKDLLIANNKTPHLYSSNIRNILYDKFNLNYTVKILQPTIEINLPDVNDIITAVENELGVKFVHNVNFDLYDKECLKHCLLDINDILLLAHILKNCRKNRMFNESDILRNKVVNMGSKPIKVCYESNNEVSIYGSTDRYKYFNVKTKEDLINLNHRYGKDECYPIYVYELNIYGEPILIGEWGISIVYVYK